MRHIVSEICQTPLTLSLSLDVCSLYVCIYTFIYITPPVWEQFLTGGPSAEPGLWVEIYLQLSLLSLRKLATYSHANFNINLCQDAPERETAKPEAMLKHPWLRCRTLNGNPVDLAAAIYWFVCVANVDFRCVWRKSDSFHMIVSQFNYDMSLPIGSSHNSFTAHQITWWNCSTALYQPYRGKNNIHPIHGTEQRKILRWRSAAVRFSLSHYCVESINMRHSSS